MNEAMDLHPSVPLPGSPARHGNGQGLIPGGRPRGDAIQRIEPVIRHMLLHINEPVRISTLSALAGVSESHFFTLFKSATGCAPIVFFIRLRMQRACELLRDQRITVKETAITLGYDDPLYFSRAFKLVVGKAPRDYRNSMRAQPPEKTTCDGRA